MELALTNHTNCDQIRNPLYKCNYDTTLYQVMSTGSFWITYHRLQHLFKQILDLLLKASHWHNHCHSLIWWTPKLVSLLKIETHFSNNLGWIWAWPAQPQLVSLYSLFVLQDNLFQHFNVQWFEEIPLYNLASCNLFCSVNHHTFRAAGCGGGLNISILGFLTSGLGCFASYQDHWRNSSNQ